VEVAKRTSSTVSLLSASAGDVYGIKQDADKLSWNSHRHIVGRQMSRTRRSMFGRLRD